MPYQTHYVPMPVRGGVSITLSDGHRRATLGREAAGATTSIHSRADSTPLGAYGAVCPAKWRWVNSQTTDGWRQVFILSRVCHGVWCYSPRTFTPGDPTLGRRLCSLARSPSPVEAPSHTFIFREMCILEQEGWPRTVYMLCSQKARGRRGRPQGPWETLDPDGEGCEHSPFCRPSLPFALDGAADTHAVPSFAVRVSGFRSSRECIRGFFS